VQEAVRVTVLGRGRRPHPAFQGSWGEQAAPQGGPRHEHDGGVLGGGREGEHAAQGGQQGGRVQRGQHLCPNALVHLQPGRNRWDDEDQGMAHREYAGQRSGRGGKKWKVGGGRRQGLQQTAAAVAGDRRIQDGAEGG
jgi:hypothetical protein